MMFMVWSAMSFGTNLLNFYMKHLPGEVYNNSMVIGFASLAYTLAGPLCQRFRTKQLLSMAYLTALLGSIALILVI
jgi:hypothetical protein